MSHSKFTARKSLGGQPPSPGNRLQQEQDDKDVRRQSDIPASKPFRALNVLRELPKRPALTIPSRDTDPQAYQHLLSSIMEIVSVDARLATVDTRLVAERLIHIARGPVYRPRNEEARVDPDESDWQAFSYLQERDVDDLPAFVMFCSLIKGRSAGLNQFDEGGKALLHVACNKLHVDAVRLLLEHGADPDLRNDPVLRSGATPLIEAIMSPVLDDTPQWQEVSPRSGDGALDRLMDVIELLLQHKADPNRTDTEGESPLHWAAIEYKPLAVARLLMAGASASVTFEQNNGLGPETPLQSWWRKHEQVWLARKQGLALPPTYGPGMLTLPAHLPWAHPGENLLDRPLYQRYIKGEELAIPLGEGGGNGPPTSRQ